MSVQSVIGQTQTAFWAVNYGFLAGNYAGGLVVNKTIAVPAEAESLPSADPRKTRLAGYAHL
ncbi:hypothetical protein L3X07_02890 [Levilactobacillus brevis]|nr:hypothetical protein [Levilactobacillus brevis]